MLEITNDDNFDGRGWGIVDVVVIIVTAMHGIVCTVVVTQKNRLCYILIGFRTYNRKRANS